MSGITSSVGLISGIDTASLIEQLLAVEARPRQLASQRIIDLQIVQTSYLDLAGRLKGLETAASSFRDSGGVFGAKNASSSLGDVLRATASNNTPEGSFSFVVDRLVTTQQMLSRGFADRDTSAFGFDELTFESDQARLSTDALLADVNGGSGVRRGTIDITQGGSTVQVDLSRAATVNEVIEAINTAQGVDVTASIDDGALVITSGSGEVTVATAEGSTGVAEDLGIAGTSTGGVLAGSALTGLSAASLLSSLNDGNGVFIGSDTGISRYDLVINVGGTDVQINVGDVFEEVTEDDVTTIEVVEPAPTTLGGVLDRINTQLSDAGFGDVTVSISGQGLSLVDTGGRAITVTERNSNSTTAADLGLLGSGTGTIQGGRLLAGLGTVLLKSLNGGSGLAATDLQLTARDGTAFSVDLSSAQTLEDVIDLINNDATNAGRITLSLNDAGNGLAVADGTAGSGNLIITGGAASELGIETDAGGVAADTVRGSNLQRKYVAMTTLLDDLAADGSIGTGTIRITDGFGVSTSINIGDDSQTVFDLISEVNAQASSAGLNLELAINDNGDGLVFREISGEPAGTQAIRIEDDDGSVAEALGLAGTGGDPSEPGEVNEINASQEVSVTFEATDTLEQALTKINSAGAGVRATIVNDGSNVSPLRISFVSEDSGREGRFILDDGGAGLGLDTLETGEDARVFFGSTDPSKAVLLTSSDNTLDGVVEGLTLDLVSTSDDPVTISVSRDNEAIEGKIEEFVSAYNNVVSRISALTSYDVDTEQRGALLGDSTANFLRTRLSTAALGEALNVSGPFSRLTDVGISFGQGGLLEFDRDRFREALAEDPTAVEEVFAARDLIAPELETEIEPGVTVSNPNASESFSKLGVVFQIEELVQEYVDSIDGVLTRRDDTVQSQIDAQERRIEAFDVRLAQRREQLTRQFVGMEQALLQLQGQQNALLALGG